MSTTNDKFYKFLMVNFSRIQLLWNRRNKEKFGFKNFLNSCTFIQKAYTLPTFRSNIVWINVEKVVLLVFKKLFVIEVNDLHIGWTQSEKDGKSSILLPKQSVVAEQTCFEAV